LRPFIYKSLLGKNWTLVLYFLLQNNKSHLGLKPSHLFYFILCSVLRLLLLPIPDHPPLSPS
jgi:hypothetical protein